MDDKDHSGAKRPVRPIELHGKHHEVHDVIQKCLNQQKYVSSVIGTGVPAHRLFTYPWSEIQPEILRLASAGLSPDRFAILCVGHVTADGLFHAHLVQSTVCLVTGRAVPVYRDEHDRDAWRNLLQLLSLKYGLPDANSAACLRLDDPPPRRASTFLQALHKAIDDAVCDEFQAGRIHDRNGIARLLVDQFQVRSIKYYEKSLKVRIQGKGSLRLVGRKYAADYCRESFVARLDAARREDARPLLERIADCEQRYAAHLEARFLRFTEAIGDDQPQPRHLTRGARISTRKHNAGREAASIAVQQATERGPLGLEAYRRPISDDVRLWLRELSPFYRSLSNIPSLPGFSGGIIQPRGKEHPTPGPRPDIPASLPRTGADSQDQPRCSDPIGSRLDDASPDTDSTLDTYELLIKRINRAKSAAAALFNRLRAREKFAHAARELAEAGSAIAHGIGRAERIAREIRGRLQGLSGGGRQSPDTRGIRPVGEPPRLDAGSIRAAAASRGIAPGVPREVKLPRDLNPVAKTNRQQSRGSMPAI